MVEKERIKKVCGVVVRKGGREYYKRLCVWIKMVEEVRLGRKWVIGGKEEDYSVYSVLFFDCKEKEGRNLKGFRMMKGGIFGWWDGKEVVGGKEKEIVRERRKRGEKELSKEEIFKELERLKGVCENMGWNWKEVLK